MRSHRDELTLDLTDDQVTINVRLKSGLRATMTLPDKVMLTPAVMIDATLELRALLERLAAGHREALIAQKAEPARV
jgi:hypothetical protein